jgi:hypothetical protein
VHLPPGEAVRTQPLEVYGAPAAHPPFTAPGFQRAWTLGLLPPPAPTVPPGVVPGLSSWDRLRLALVLCFGGLLLGLLLANVLGLEALGFLVAGCAFGTGWWLFHSTDRRDEVEHSAGYTSGRTYAGLWRLASDGRVLRPPDVMVPPPGWYPSPYFPGVLQRWDGPGWRPLPQFWWRQESSYFRAPSVPFL